MQYSKSPGLLETVLYYNLSFDRDEVILSTHGPLEVKIKLFELITLFDYLAIIIKYVILTGIFQIDILNAGYYKIRNSLVEISA